MFRSSIIVFVHSKNPKLHGENAESTSQIRADAMFYCNLYRQKI
jgi:hypothetical protein